GVMVMVGVLVGRAGTSPRSAFATARSSAGGRFRDRRRTYVSRCTRASAWRPMRHRWPIRYVHLVRWQAMSRLRRRPKRWPSLPPDAVDALCAVVLIVVGVASVFGQSLEASDGTVIYDKPGLLAAVT